MKFWINHYVQAKAVNGLLKNTTILFIITAPECVHDFDCPNEGQNYKCNVNVCECEDGFFLNGNSCEVQGKYIYQILKRR